MKTRPNLNELAQVVFEANKAKGFHDKDHSNEHYLCLVIAELMEAVEAHRKNRFAKIPIEKENTVFDARTFHVKNKFFVENFLQHVKDTVEDELADAVIRLLDLAGAKDIKIYDRVNNDNCAEIFKDKSFVENIFHIQNVLNLLTSRLDVCIMLTINIIDALCKYMQIDLWLHVELKMMYNQTRPYKHGKEY